MKTNFLLALLTFNGLLFGVNSAFATTGSASQTSQQITTLSQTISKSIDLGSDYHNLMESAINRALLAREDRSPQPIPQVAGGIKAPVSHSPIINGIAHPKPQPSSEPIINGVMVPSQSPQPNRSPNREAIINGTIAVPARR